MTSKHTRFYQIIPFLILLSVAVPAQPRLGLEPDKWAILLTNQNTNEESDEYDDNDLPIVIPDTKTTGLDDNTLIEISSISGKMLPTQNQPTTKPPIKKLGQKQIKNISISTNSG